jgi:putative SOS response-associated peptidase YedK
MAERGQAAEQPYAFELANGYPFAFAGIWDGWKDGQGPWLSCSPLDHEASELMSQIRPRMPVILDSRDYDRWLDRTKQTFTARFTARF